MERRDLVLAAAALDAARIELDQRFLVRQVDVDALHAGHAPDRPADARDAEPAGHAADAVLDLRGNCGLRHATGISTKSPK
jgi:hypothetical protein